MKVTETEIPGLLIIEPGVFNDPRGYFFETYREGLYKSFGIFATNLIKEWSADFIISWLPLHSQNW